MTQNPSQQLSSLYKHQDMPRIMQVQGNLHFLKLSLHLLAIHLLSYIESALQHMFTNVFCLPSLSYNHTNPFQLSFPNSIASHAAKFVVNHLTSHLQALMVHQM